MSQEPSNADLLRAHSELMDAHSELMERLGNLDGKFTASIEEAREHREEILKQVKATNGRVTVVEKWMAEMKLRYKIKQEQREDRKFQNVENIEKQTVNKSVWNDPKLVIGVLSVLGALTTYLIFLQGGK